MVTGAEATIYLNVCTKTVYQNWQILLMWSTTDTWLYMFLEQFGSHGT